MWGNFSYRITRRSDQVIPWYSKKVLSLFLLRQRPPIFVGLWTKEGGSQLFSHVIHQSRDHVIFQKHCTLILKSVVQWFRWVESPAYFRDLSITWFTKNALSLLLQGIWQQNLAKLWLWLKEPHLLGYVAHHNPIKQNLRHKPQDL